MSGLPFEGEIVDQVTFGSPYEQTGRFCAICFELLEDKEKVIILRCKPVNHIFCLDCIQGWAEKRRTCPLCKCVF